MIDEYKLDMVALQETWIEADDAVAVRNDLAPTGYSVLHIHRLLVNTGRGRQQPSPFAARRHQGLAVIYRDGLDVTAHRLQSTSSPTTFDCQVVKVKSGKSSNVVIANLYR